MRKQIVDGCQRRQGNAFKHLNPLLTHTVAVYGLGQ